MIAARSRLRSALRRLAAVLMTTNGMPLTACAQASPTIELTRPIVHEQQIGRQRGDDRRRHQRAQDQRAQQRFRRNDVADQREGGRHAEHRREQRRKLPTLSVTQKCADPFRIAGDASIPAQRQPGRRKRQEVAGAERDRHAPR